MAGEQPGKIGQADAIALEAQAGDNMIKMVHQRLAERLQGFIPQQTDQLLVIVAARPVAGRRGRQSPQRGALAEAGHHLGEHRVAGDSLQLNMKVSGVADRRRAVVRRMGLLFTLNNVLQRRQMRRLAARDHIGRLATSSSARVRKIAWDSSTLGLVTCAPRLGVNVTSCTAASRCSTFLMPVRLTP